MAVFAVGVYHSRDNLEEEHNKHTVNNKYEYDDKIELVRILLLWSKHRMFDISMLRPYKSSFFSQMYVFHLYK